MMCDTSQNKRGKGNCIPARDHLGNNYESITEMCKAWGACRTNFERKIKNGKSIEECLSHYFVKDHKGNKFKNAKEMCQFWGVNYGSYNYKRFKGFSLAECLTDEKKVTDYKGNRFKSYAEMCRFYNINYNSFLTIHRQYKSISECLKYCLRRKREKLQQFTTSAERIDNFLEEKEKN